MEGELDIALESPLTPREKELLAQCEETIEEGIKVFYEVGVALTTIMQGRFYRATHATFKDYMKERWGMSRQHGYRLIDAAESFKVVAQTGILPSSERQLRPLKDLTNDQRLAVWQAALALSESEGRDLTNQHVVQAKERLLGHPERRKTRPRKIALRLCDVCLYSFSDEHHIKPRSSGGKRFQSIALCPNHHRFATLVQHMLDHDHSRESIEVYARRHFDPPFNKRVLNLLLDRSYHFSSALSNSFDLFLDQISAELRSEEEGNEILL